MFLLGPNHGNTDFKHLSEHSMMTNLTTGAGLDPLLPSLSCEMVHVCNDLFSSGLSHAIMSSERCVGYKPCELLGGEDGLCRTSNTTEDFNCAPHLESGDGSQSVSVWSESKPGQATSWYFVFPNFRCSKDGRVYHGLVVKPCHGAAISWDGRLVRHCTSIPDRGCPDNSLFSNFYAGCGSIIQKMTSGHAQSLQIIDKVLVGQK